MYRKTECVAMILAGGQGSRLYALTENTAKPAVPFGGKYRIIDFTMSNCINSGIYTVGVLTQYQPLVLNEYIGNGSPWDLDRVQSGVTILPPYQAKQVAEWYKGTANAIYQNLAFINRYNPDYVLILSGDHIYKMDYGKMLDAHKKTGADATIAVLNVPFTEASRFGIMSTDDKLRITEFEEKPMYPKSTKASMGIYVFSRDVLEKYLIYDEASEGSDNDFGKNIIPSMLKDKRKLYAYPFEGYWKDVGTIQSLWEANMDLLGKNPAFNLRDTAFRIYSRTEARPPHRVGNRCRLINSIVTEGCEINGTVENCVLSSGVIINEGAYVRDSVLMADVTVGKNCTVDYSIIDSGVKLGDGCTVGKPKDKSCGVTVVAGGIELAPGSCIADGAIADKEYCINVLV